MKKNFKKIGCWWADNSIELVKIDGKVYALSGWNGEVYGNCWRCTGKSYTTASTERHEIKPIYSDADENDCYEVIYYEVR